MTEGFTTPADSEASGNRPGPSALGSKQLARAVFGLDAVRAYEEVKAFYMRLGDAACKAFAEAVGGWAPRPSDREGCDMITRLGRWEAAMGANTKNTAGERADIKRCPGRCVQLTGSPKPGWMGAEEFLELHGVDGGVARSLLLTAAQECRR